MRAPRWRHSTITCSSTAPSGRTLPRDEASWSLVRYLKARVQNRSDLAPDSELERQRHQYQAAMQSLINPTKPALVTVCRPHAGSGCDRKPRTVDELQDTGVVNQMLVLNGVLPEK